MHSISFTSGFLLTLYTPTISILFFRFPNNLIEIEPFQHTKHKLSVVYIVVQGAKCVVGATVPGRLTPAQGKCLYHALYNTKDIR